VKLEDSHPGKLGRSILEQIWEELDSIMDQLRSSSPIPEVEGWDGVRDRAELRGRAQGIAYAIAVIVNPYAPDVPEVKAEARKRWEKRNNAGGEGKEAKAPSRKRRQG
jgi:hypothetical protein